MAAEAWIRARVVPSFRSRRFADPDYAGEANGSREFLDPVYRDGLPLSGHDVNRIVSLYDGEIARINYILRMFLQLYTGAFEEEPKHLLDKTLFVFASDHGEELYERHGYWAHSKSVYSSVLHVPLFIRHPPSLTGRRVLVVNGLLNALFIALCATFRPGMPVAVMAAVLFVGGLVRSMQFTALNTLAFADVPRAVMPDANTLFSTAGQLANGLGVTLAASAWRLAGQVWPDLPALDIRVAFLAIAVVALVSVLDPANLPRTAGDHVARPARVPSP